MVHSSTLIISRLAWCRVQQKQASTKEESARLLAEEEGLLDAMRGRDRTEIYSQNQCSIVTSYEIGLQDGQALMGLQRWCDRKPSISNNGEEHHGAVIDSDRVTSRGVSDSVKAGYHAG